jgi:hypothetical protein
MRPNRDQLEGRTPLSNSTSLDRKLESNSSIAPENQNPSETARPSSHPTSKSRLNRNPNAPNRPEQISRKSAANKEPIHAKAADSFGFASSGFV